MPLVHCYASEGDYGNLEKELKKPGIDINERMQNTKNTPLNLAAGHGHVNVVRLLLTKKPDLYSKNEFGCDPFLSALRSIYRALTTESAASLLPGCKEVCKLLLAYEAKFLDQSRDSKSIWVASLESFRKEYEGFKMFDQLNDHLTDILDRKTWPSLMEKSSLTAEGKENVSLKNEEEQVQKTQEQFSEVSFSLRQRIVKANRANNDGASEKDPLLTKTHVKSNSNNF